MPKNDFLDYTFLFPDATYISAFTNIQCVVQVQKKCSFNGNNKRQSHDKMHYAQQLGQDGKNINIV